MNCNSTISIHDLVSTSIHSREASSVIIDVIEKDPCNYIELDFSSVVYISRAFADQFHKDKINCAINYKKTIIVTNANDIVLSMFQAVAKTQSVPVTKNESIPIYKYTSSNDLENFLLSF